MSIVTWREHGLPYGGFSIDCRSDDGVRYVRIQFRPEPGGGIRIASGSGPDLIVAKDDVEGFARAVSELRP